MILIADSGSTKTIWAAIVVDRTPLLFQTRGYNPYHISSDEIMRDLIRNLPDEVNKSHIEHVHFFGAGCAGEKSIAVVEQALKGIFRFAQLTVSSDIHGASLALFGKKAGLSCIIGTGANSAIWDGSLAKIVRKSLGYILGDEGSGVSIGIRFLKKYLRKEFSAPLMNYFQSAIGLSDEEILNVIYKEGDEKKFIASFVPLLNGRINHPEIREIIQAAFSDYISTFILPVPDYHIYNLGFCGSPAFYYQDILQKQLSIHGLSAEKIIIHPMDGLINYFKQIVK